MSTGKKSAEGREGSHALTQASCSANGAQHVDTWWKSHVEGVGVNAEEALESAKCRRKCA